jgi:hypothetical protein
MKTAEKIFWTAAGIILGLVIGRNNPSLSKSAERMSNERWRS